MADDPTPKTVKREDYAWCESCKLYWPRKILKATSSFFSDDPKGQRCPEGHDVKEEAAS